MWTRRHVIAGVVCLGSPIASATPWRLPILPDVTGWPSLLDALPPRIQAEVRAGRYAGDLSDALRDAIATGANFTVPAGVYPFAGDRLEMRKPGQQIVGTGGLLRRLSERDGLGLLVSAPGVALHNITMDGRAPAKQTSHHNDMVKISGDDCLLSDLQIKGAWGSNLRLDGVKRCRVVRPVLTDAYQNNLLVCNAPTQDILIDSPVCQRTVSQNNIFVTASEGSTDNGQIVSRVEIRNPLCTEAGDTAIELGYHCFDCQVIGGKVVNSYHPGLLQRDGRRNRWVGTIVENKPLADQYPDYDGVAAVPQWELPSWDSDTEFNGIIVKGHARRAAFYWGQSGIRRTNCTADALALQEKSVRRVGSGDMKAGAVSHIVVRGGTINGFAIGDNWNFDGKSYERTGCITEGVEFNRCEQVFNCYNTIPVRSAIIGNRGVENTGSQIQLFSARLQPTDDQPGIGLIYENNTLVAAGRPALPILLPPDSPPPEALLLSGDSCFIRVPATGRAVVSFNGIAGQYHVYSNGAQATVTLVRRSGGFALQGSPLLQMPDGRGIQVAVENDMLVLHQRSERRNALWAKIAGPGIQGTKIDGAGLA